MISWFDINGKLSHYVGRVWSLLNVLLSGTRMEIQGKNKIEKGRPYIVMSNHQSLFDVWALIGMLPLQIRWIVKSEIRKVPIFGYTLDRMGHVYIDRKRRQDAYLSLNTAVRKIEKGASLVIFPEGTRSVDGRLLKFRYGGAIMALKSGAPILPVTINGGRFVLPKNTLSLRPGRIQIIIGDKIDTRRFDTKSKNELMATVKSAIEENLDLDYGAIHRKHLI
jgi:1-acyl-sn-glycerol-3-phosphate acyltransferase